MRSILKTRGVAEASFLRKLQIKRVIFRMTLLICSSSSAVNPAISRPSCAEGINGTTERISTNIYQHAAVCEHFGV